RAIYRGAGSVAFNSRSTSQSNGVGCERTWRFARFLCNLLIVFRPFAGRETFAPVRPGVFVFISHFGWIAGFASSHDRKGAQVSAIVVLPPDVTATSPTLRVKVSFA